MRSVEGQTTQVGCSILLRCRTTWSGCWFSVSQRCRFCGAGSVEQDDVQLHEPVEEAAERVVISNVPAETEVSAEVLSRSLGRQWSSCGDRGMAAMEKDGPNSPAVDVPEVHESRIERGIEAGWIEERRRERRSSPSVPDWSSRVLSERQRDSPGKNPREKICRIIWREWSIFLRIVCPSQWETDSGLKTGADVMSVAMSQVCQERYESGETGGVSRSSPIGSFRKLPLARGRSHCRGGTGGHSRAVEPTQTYGKTRRIGVQVESVWGCPDSRNITSRWKLKIWCRSRTWERSSSSRWSQKPILSRGKWCRQSSGGWCPREQESYRIRDEKHRAGRSSDVSRKQALPGSVDLRPSQHDDVAVQFRNNDSVMMSEDDRMSEKARKARAREMKLEKFDGTSSIDSFLAKFEICSRHNEWTEEDRMAHLQCAMVNNAAQILWTWGPKELQRARILLRSCEQDMVRPTRQLYTALSWSTGGEIEGKVWQRWWTTSVAMVVLAYPGPTSPMKEAVACDAFLEALGDAEMALKIREREPPTLEDAFQYALRLEAYSGSAAVKPIDGDRRGHVRMLQEVQAPEDRCLKYLKEMGRWNRRTSSSYSVRCERLWMANRRRTKRLMWRWLTANLRHPVAVESRMVVVVGQFDLRQFVLDVDSQGIFGRSARTENDQKSTQKRLGCNP